jgi:fumarylacetoacetate (FAA) hydrolase
MFIDCALNAAGLLETDCRDANERSGGFHKLVHDRDGGVPAGAFAPTVQALLDDRADLAPVLHHRRQALDRTGWGGAHAFDPKQCMAPPPRAYQWVYRNHARLI